MVVSGFGRIGFLLRYGRHALTVELRPYRPVLYSRVQYLVQRIFHPRFSVVRNFAFSIAAGGILHGRFRYGRVSSDEVAAGLASAVLLYCSDPVSHV